jgi:hypothetical protein
LAGTPGIKTVLFVTLAGILIVVGFTVLWSHEAYSVSIQSSISQSVPKGDVVMVVEQTTIDVQNYYADSINITYGPGGVFFGGLNNETGMSLSQVFSYKPVLNSTSIQLVYAGKPLSQPSVTQVNGTFGFSNQTIPAFSESVTTLKWSYAHVQGDHASLYINFTLHRDARIPVFGPLVAWLGSFPADYAVPFALFILGGIFGGIALGPAFSKVSDAFRNLLDPQKNDGDLKSSLPSLAFLPNTLGFGIGTLLSPAITIFKIIVTREVTARNYKSLEAAGDLNPDPKTPYSLFLSNPATQPASTLLEARTIGLVLGFLATIGLTFSWNVGAMAPIILSAGVAYLSYNMGTLCCMLGRKGDKYLIVPIGILAIVILVVVWNDTISYFRI